jgi:aminoglycoside phosphotransferase (APT) family kinase protein
MSIAGIQRDNVTRFFHTHVPGAGGDLEFSLISGGRSNLTYLVSNGVERWVLRRPPLGHVLPTAHDMRREFRVLSALRDTAVPVPRTFALCEDTAVNDAPFYVMEYRPGIVLTNELPPGFAATPAERRQLGEQLVRTLAQLHAVDFRAVGLADFGRPEGYLERQVRRWAQQWERSKTGELPAIEDLARRLGAALPASPDPTIVHGDYRLGNVAFDPHDASRLVAIFDWEMATLGDPLADLGYTLIYWSEADDPPATGAMSEAAGVTRMPGFFKRADIIEAYARHSGRDVDGIDFYQVLALYKLAVISEGIYARYRMGKTLGEGFDNMLRTTESLAQRALDIANASSDRRLRAD